MPIFTVVALQDALHATVAVKCWWCGRFVKGDQAVRAKRRDGKPDMPFCVPCAKRCKHWPEDLYSEVVWPTKEGQT